MKKRNEAVAEIKRQVAEMFYNDKIFLFFA